MSLMFVSCDLGALLSDNIRASAGVTVGEFCSRLSNSSQDSEHKAE